MRDLPIVSPDRPVNLVHAKVRAALRVRRETLHFTRVRTARGPVRIQLWIPLTPLVGLLSPFVMLASPFARIGRRTRHVPTVRAAWALGAVLMSLSGTWVNVETARATIRIHIL
jgi:hypothetical protein